MSTISLTTTSKGTAEIRLAGRLDAFGIREIRGRLDALVVAGCVHAAVDLRHVEFLDSAGLAAIVRLVRALRLRGGDVVLVGADREPIARTLSLTGMDAIIPSAQTLAAAHQALA